MSTFEEKSFLQELENNMQKRMEYFVKNLSSIRTSKAMPSMLDEVMANITNPDGTSLATPLNRIASVTCADERTLLINVWDIKHIKSIEKAIMESKLGLSVAIDGNSIRATIPPLNGERRQELVKLVAEYAEKSKIEVRNVRAAALKQMKDAKLSQDLNKRLEKQVQNITDKYVEEVEKKLNQKKNELQK